MTATSSDSGATSPITVSGTASPVVVTGLTSGKAYTFSVTASNVLGAGTATSASSAVTAYNAASQLVLTTSAATAASGSAFTTQPVVQIQDAAGTKVANSSQQVTMTVSTGGTVVGTSTVTASSGVATFTNVGISGVNGTAYTLTFATAPTPGTLTSATQSITASEGPASALTLTTSAAGSVNGSAFTTQPVITIKDSGGNLITTSKTVTMTVSTGGTVVGTASVTTTNGTATFTNVGISGTAGTAYTLTYAVSGVTSVTQTITPGGFQLFTAAAGAASGAAFTTQPVVRKLTSGNVLDTSDSTTVVTMTVSRGASIVGTATKTMVAGVATFSGAGVSGFSGKTYTITYSAPGLASATQTISPTTGAAAQLVITYYPTFAVNGSAFGFDQASDYMKVEVRDAGGNTVNSSATVPATVNNSGTLLGTTAPAASAGIATFTGLGITGTTGTVYTVTFTSGSLGTATYTTTLLGTSPVTAATVAAASETRTPINYRFSQLAAAGTANVTYGMALSSDGSTVFYSDTTAHKIKMVTVATGAVADLAGSGTAGGVDATGTAASFNRPYGLHVQSDGSLIVAEYDGARVRKITFTGAISAANAVVTTLAGTGGRGSRIDGPLANGLFYSALGVTTNGSGLVFVVDEAANYIKLIDTTVSTSSYGYLTTLFGDWNTGNGHINAAGYDARFDQPTAIARDSLGNLFVTDFLGNNIRKITFTGSPTSPIISPATAVVSDYSYFWYGGTGNNDGAVASATFTYPRSIAIDSANNLYVYGSSFTSSSTSYTGLR